MIQVLKKNDQFNDVIFGGRFFANKPVYNGQENVQPYSSLFYWSNAYAQDDCAFGLHPHKGFEIMTFLWEGYIEHYDTATRIWTPLHAGDFQVIQSNSGIEHQEKIAKGSRVFQIWFDPNYVKALTESPAYVDYLAENFPIVWEDGVQVIHYIGGNSVAVVATPGLSIKKILFDDTEVRTISLQPEQHYMFYVLNGSGRIGEDRLEQDDALRVTDLDQLEIQFQGSLFCISLPKTPAYKPIWLA